MSYSPNWQSTPINIYRLNLDSSERNRATQTRIRLRIPKKYQHEPIISQLASQHNLQVNITAALLANNSSDDGWFDLELSGHSQQIDSALIYLSDLDIEVWHESEITPDGW